MKHISVTDTTIRQAGKAAGYTLSFREKIELAKLLDRLGVSVIELHAVENPKIDSLLIKSVASAVKESAVCVPVALDPASVSLVWAALREAKHPRIQVPAPVSAVQMEYLAGKKQRFPPLKNWAYLSVYFGARKPIPLFLWGRSHAGRRKV